MSEPPLQPPATAGETRVTEIDRDWTDLDDAASEEAILELRDLAASAALRYAYQRKAHQLADLIDAQFVPVPATTDEHENQASKDDGENDTTQS